MTKPQSSTPSAFPPQRRPPTAALVYSVTLMTLAVAALSWASMTGLEFGRAPQASRLDFLLVWIVPIALVARFLSFTLGKVTFSLDTPVFIAAMFHLGPLPSALAVLLVMGIYAGYRVIRRIGPYSVRETTPLTFVRAAFAPLVTAALALGFSHGAQLLWIDPAHPGGGFTILAVRVIGLSVAFLVLQYAVILTRYVLEGQTVMGLIRQAVRPGFTAEMTMLPLAALFVWSLDRADPMPFLVLGGSSLVLADIFRRLARAQERAMQTVEQLERLVSAGEQVFATLGFRQVLTALVEAIATELPGCRRALAGIWDEDLAPPRCKVVARARDGGLQTDVDDPALHEALAERLLQARPGTFTVAAAEPWRALIVPFAVDGKPEGFIGADLGPMQAADSSSYQALVVQASDELRRLASIAGGAIHNARLYRLATIDGLTGLYVRRFFDRRFSEEVARCRRGGGALSVLLIDLDDFKSVNDRHGHLAGDGVLQWLAGLLQQTIRLTDVPCRYGGDEFVVLLPETEVAAACGIAERLKAAIDTHELHHDATEIRVTASIGVAGVICNSGERVPDLVAAADAALYSAKAATGKGQIVVAADLGMSRSVDARTKEN